MSDDSEKETKYTIITGNPVAGFDLYGIFDSHAEAFEYADSRMRLPDDWSIMAINAVQPEREETK